MAVIASNLSSGLRAQQQGDYSDQKHGQEYVGDKELTEHEHRVSSEPLRPQQRVGEVKQQAQRDEAGE